MLVLIKDFFSLLNKETNRKIYFLCCVVVLNAIFELAALVIVYSAFNYNGSGDERLFQLFSTFETINTQALLIMFTCVVYVFKVLATFWVNRFVYATSISIRESLQQRMISKLLAVDLEYVSNKPESYWTQAVTLDAYALEGRLITPLFVILAEIAVFTAIGFYLLFLNPLIFTMIVCVFSIVAVVLFLTNNPKLVLAGKMQQEGEKNLVQLLNEILSGWREIKIDQVRVFFDRKSVNHLTLVSKNNFAALSIGLVPKVALEVTMFILIFMSTASYFLFETEALTENFLALVTVYGLSAYRLLPSISKVISHLQSFKHATFALQTYINELHDVRS